MIPLANTAVRDFRECGYAVVRNFFSDAEMTRLSEAALALHDAKVERSTVGATLGRISFQRTYGVWQQSQAVRDIGFDNDLAALASDMLGCDALRVIADDVFEKRPGDRVSTWHYDKKFVPIDNDRFISIWIPLTDVTLEMGTMAYVRGSHRQRFLERMAPFGGEIRAHMWYATQIALRNGHIDRIAANRGDVLFHHGNTMHMAGANRSTKRRTAYGVHFADARSRFVTPANDSQRLHVRECGWEALRPGDEIETESSPEVFVRRNDRRTASIARAEDRRILA